MGVMLEQHYLIEIMLKQYWERLKKKIGHYWNDGQHDRNRPWFCAYRMCTGLIGK